MSLITTAEAAEKLGIHQTRVQVLIRNGRLPARLMGGTYIIEESDLALVANRKTGRPKKTETGEVQGAVEDLSAGAQAVTGAPAHKRREKRREKAKKTRMGAKKGGGAK